MSAKGQTYSGWFEEWSEEFVKQNQELYISIIEKILREQTNFPSELKIVWRNLS